MNQFLEDTKIFECGNFIKSNLNSFVLNESQYCLMCNSYIKEFIPSGNEGKLFLEHHIIGGGYRKIVFVHNAIVWIERVGFCMF